MVSSSTGTEVEFKVIIKKQGDLTAFLSFNKDVLNPNEAIGVEVMLSNSGKDPKRAVLLLVVYNGDKMIDIKEKTITVEKSKTISDELLTMLPRDVSKVTVKAFLTEGNDSLTATRNIAAPIELKR